MATLHHEPPNQLADDGSSHLLLEVGRTIRDNFHVLCGLSLVFLMVALPWVVLATATSWSVAWAPLVLTTAPVWMIIVWVANRMLVGDVTGGRAMLEAGRRLALPALAIGIPPALCGTVLLVMARDTGQASWWVLGVMIVAGISLAVGLLLVPAIPLAIRHDLAGAGLWQVSAAVVLKRPAQIAGTFILALLGIGLAMAVGPVVLLGVAPLGVLVAAITLPDSD